MAEDILAGSVSQSPTAAPTSHFHKHAIPGLDDHPHASSVVHTYLLSPNQERVLSLLLLISATLSIVGSLTIVNTIVRNRRRASSYDRLLLGLSCSSIIASITFGIGPFLLPRTTSTRVWAFGNGPTCTALGFFLQLSYADILYNAMLSYYFLMKVRCSLKRFRISYWESWMHCVAIGIPVFTACLGVAFGIYHEITFGWLGCWINDYPHDHIWGLVFGLLPFGFTVLSILINNLIIYQHVKTTTGSVIPPGTKHVTRSSNAVEHRGGERSIRGEHGLMRDDDEPNRGIRNQQIRDVARQSYMYVGAFFLSCWSPFCIQLLETMRNPNDRDIYALLVLQSIFLPLQGFVNMFIYHHPNYTRVRAAFPELSRVSALYQACLSPSIPDTNEDIISVPYSAGRTLPSAGEQEETIPTQEETNPTATASGYFRRTPPEDYFNACAQSVLSEPTRSTLRTVTEDEQEYNVDSNDTEETKQETLSVEEDHGNRDLRRLIAQTVAVPGLLGTVGIGGTDGVRVLHVELEHSGANLAEEKRADERESI